MRWSEAVTLEFVKLYLKHECLWNPVHLGYKLKYQREEAYLDIISVFKSTTNKSLSVIEVKNKIKNLRTTYGQEVNKILQKSRPDCIYEPSLIWFREMDRCLKNVHAHRYSMLYTQDTPDVSSSHQIWVDNELGLNNLEEVNPEPLIQTTDYDDDNDVYNRVMQEGSRISTKNKESPTHSHNRKNKLTTHSFNVSKTVIKEDEFDIYGEYIAAQLRNMDLQKAIQVQLAIQNIISEARLSDL